jgi:hypothetical protein
LIYPTSAQYEKIAVIDKIFNCISVEDLRHFSEREEIVSKLKGQTHNGFTFSDLIIEHNELNSKVQNMQGEIFALKADIGAFLKAFLKPYEYDTQNSVNNLKSKYNVY